MVRAMNGRAARILVVDDERMIRWGLARALEEAGYQVDQAGGAKEALEIALREPTDAVLLDLKLPDGSGIEVLRALRKHSPLLPVVMITAHASIEGAVEAVKEGAYDYLSKPFELEEVIQTVARALEAGRLREEVQHQRKTGLLDYGVQGMIAQSAAMKEVVKLVQRVAHSEATTILLLGESGVGKGLVARALHYAGASLERPFMHITCTALPESLLESELFGHEKGAFTDAKAQRKGLFELADGGTVFLDEIGDISPALQGKLLRVLEEKVFRRVGGTRDLRVAVRIIAATNKDLAAEVEAGRFRRDLYFRLKVIPIEIPPLRARPEDVAPLAAAFMQRFNAEFHKALQGLDPGALELMRAYAWPGNVRELRNTIERAVLLSDRPWISPADLPAEMRASEACAEPASGEVAFRLPDQGLSMDELEREMLRQALQRTRGNRTQAARLLGMNRDRIRYRIQKFNLEDAVREAP